VRRLPFVRAFTLVAAALVMGMAFGGCVGQPESKSSSIEAKKIAAAPRDPPVFPGQYRFDGAYSQVLAEGPYGLLARTIHYIPSEIDGADIHFAVWRPDTPPEVKVPVIIQASPYYLDTTALDNFGVFVTDNFVPHGYAYVQLAIRSTGDSGGCDDFRGPNMVKDLSTAVTWLASQDWSNGNVSLIGISYIGTTPWYAASSGNPAIKTIVPISGSTNPWEVYNRNGSAESRSPAITLTYGGQAAGNPYRSPEHVAGNFVCPDGSAYEAWAAGTYGGVAGEKEPFSQWWEDRNVRPKVEANYKGSIFVIHGFEDWNVDPAVVFPWARTLNLTYGLPVKTMVGQWVHTYPDQTDPDKMRWDYAETLLHWWDYWLKGKTQVDTGPWAQLQDNQMRWRNEMYYPPIDADWKTLHLGPNAQLLDAPGGAGFIRLLPAAAPLPLDQRSTNQDAAALYTDFVLGPLEEDMRISGLPRAHVTVTPDGPGGYIAAWLLDVDPATGAEQRIGWTSMNLKYADGTDKATPVTPGQPLLAKMEMQPMDAVVPAGHSLALRIWINGHSDRIPSIPPTPIRVEWGGGVTSMLELPIIERGEDAFFTPPMPPE
jgi:predicted acyl esterase